MRRVVVRSLLPLMVLIAGPWSLTACQKKDDKAKLPAEPAGASEVATPERRPASVPGGGRAAAAPVPGDPPAPRVDAPADPARDFFTGTTEPLRRTMLMPRTGGPVARVEAKEGDLVKKGQLLVVQDTTTSRLHLRQAEAGRGLAQAQLAAVRTEWRRIQGLVRDKAVPRSQFDKVDAQLKVALAGLAQADAGIALAKRMLVDSLTRAPFSGVITKVLIEVGQWVSTMPPSQLMMLEHIDRLKLRVQLPETALTRVKVGTALRVHFSSVNRTIRAKVTQVVQSLDPRTRSFSVIAELDNADHSLRPGMFAEVHVVGGAPPKESSRLPTSVGTQLAERRR